MPKAADVHRFPPPGGMTRRGLQYFSKQVLYNYACPDYTNKRPLGTAVHEMILLKSY